MFDDLRQLLQADPFRPFRVHLNDGRHFDVLHPEFMGISRSTVTIAVPSNGEEAHHQAIIQVRNITSIEPLSEAQQQS